MGLEKITLFCTAFLLIQSYLIAQTDVTNKVNSVLDLTMLQVQLSQAATNGQPDIINIGKGVFDLSLLDNDLFYRPLPKPRVPKEEQYPLTIVGAGAGKTIFDAGKSTRKLIIMTGQLKDDMGASITVKGITFRNGGLSLSGRAGLTIGTKKAMIEVRDCEFIATNKSHGPALIASTGTKIGGMGAIRIIGCKFDSLSSPVTLSNIRTNTYVEESTFTDFRDNNALDIGSNKGVCLVSKCTFANNHSIREAPLIAFVFGGGTVEITKSTFENNFGAQGGAVKISGRESTINFYKNTLKNNRGGKSGSTLITMEGSGKITVEANLFSENNNNTQGGGLTIITSGNKKAGVDDSKNYLSVNNNIFSKNFTAGDGGGLYVEIRKGKAAIINNTIVNNKTMYSPKCNTAAGLCLKTISNDATAWIYNNIIWENTCKDASGIDLNIDNDPDVSAVGWFLEPDGIGAKVFVSNNIVGKDDFKVKKSVEVKKQLNLDPQLDSGFKLKSTSPAIDAGTSQGHGILGSKDFEGKKVPIDGNGDGKKVVDIGAIEFKQK